ncbi:protein kinase [Stigmatella sp. ncwal1]|uniref:Protein kinase n=1 Tax=Stigmatella ashevillensis TaxID=2995309 RepID=A0ABT5DHR8_9BACT|nr:protein kinase [Stigmatella ashevillena]MDC0712663.1 protein kinase [Stigmatella ashevillena]
MTTDILHPDKLGPGSSVGPWNILELLGAGGFGRVFKAEQDGKLYALKMATRLPGQKAPGEEDIDGRCQREATALRERTPHPNLPCLHAVGRWPDAEQGFLYIVTEYVDGWRFHDWREAVHPTAAQLVDVVLEIVRVVAELHKAGIHHRDLNAHNILIRREDGRPCLLDFGSARLPGVTTLTKGLPPVALPVLPPEALRHACAHGETARFDGGATADLYAIGVLLYQALTDGYPFNPKLSLERLATVIMLRSPRPPHRVNPKVPESLSAITLKLLSKRPEDRFASAESLFQALWEAAKERTSSTWKVPLDLPESGPAPMTEEEHAERQRDEEKNLQAAWDQEQEQAEEDSTDTEPPQQKQRVQKAVKTTMACALLISAMALAWWMVRVPQGMPAEPSPIQQKGQEVALLEKPPEAETPMPSKEPVPVKTPKNASKPSPPQRDKGTVGKALAIAACTALAGCPGAQVYPKAYPEPCPAGALETMKKLNIRIGETGYAAFFPVGGVRKINVQEGWTSVRLIGRKLGDLPTGTVLSGRLIFGNRVYGRLTQAHFQGQDIPICVEMRDVEERGRGLIREANDDPNAVTVYSTLGFKTVSTFE